MSTQTMEPLQVGRGRLDGSHKRPTSQPCCFCHRRQRAFDLPLSRTVHRSAEQLCLEYVQAVLVAEFSVLSAVRSVEIDMPDAGMIPAQQDRNYSRKCDWIRRS